jgi:hypothetical protein
MATKVLTTASTVLCDVAAPPAPAPPTAHGGTVAKTSTAKLTVNGAAVLANRVQPPIGLGAVTGCANPPNPPTTIPCSMVATVTAGVANRLTVGGVAVLLETLKGTTLGTPPAPAAVPPGTLSATANQNRLTAI